MDLKYLCQSTIELVKKTGSFIHEERTHFSQHMVKAKGTQNYVTYVDTESEKKLVNKRTAYK